MVSHAGAGDVRTSMTMNLQFTRGRHGAAARLEVHERPAGRVGLLALRGWVDLSATRGIESALDHLATRGISRLVVDCSQLLHVDYRLVPRLAEALLGFEARHEPVVDVEQLRAVDDQPRDAARRRGAAGVRGARRRRGVVRAVPISARPVPHRGLRIEALLLAVSGGPAGCRRSGAKAASPGRRADGAGRA